MPSTADSAETPRPPSVGTLAYRPGDTIWALMVADTLASVERYVRSFHRPLPEPRRGRAEVKLAHLVGMLEQHASAAS